MSSHVQAQETIIRNFVRRSQALGWICYILNTDPKWGPDRKSVLRIRIRKFLGLPDTDALVRGPDPDPDPSIIKQK